MFVHICLWFTEEGFDGTISAVFGFCSQRTLCAGSHAFSFWHHVHEDGDCMALCRVGFVCIHTFVTTGCMCVHSDLHLFVI